MRNTASPYSTVRVAPHGCIRPVLRGNHPSSSVNDIQSCFSRNSHSAPVHPPDRWPTPLSRVSLDPCPHQLSPSLGAAGCTPLPLAPNKGLGRTTGGGSLVFGVHRGSRRDTLSLTLRAFPPPSTDRLSHANQALGNASRTRRSTPAQQRRRSQVINFGDSSPPQPSVSFWPLVLRA
jgi:hypothetical protein